MKIEWKKAKQYDRNEERVKKQYDREEVKMKERKEVLLERKKE
jgi:hypothetical protein